MVRQVYGYPDKALPTGASDAVLNKVDMTASGKAFLQVCSDSIGEHRNPNPGYTQFAGAGFCFGYVAGVLSGLDLASGQLEGKARSNFLNRVGYCPPSTVTGTDKVGIVLKYISDNPGKADLPPEDLAVAALRGAFPCEKKK